MPSIQTRVILIVLLIVVVLVVRPSSRRWLKETFRDLVNPSPHLRDGRTSRTSLSSVEEIVDPHRPNLPPPKRIGGGLEQKAVVIGEAAVWYLEGGAGDGRASVVLLHGFGGDKEQWIPLTGHLLAAGYHVIAPDLPGCGQSAKDAEAAFDITTLTRHIRVLVHRLGLESYHLVGSSIGGTIAASIAYAAKEQVRTLTLIEPFGVQVPYESELAKLLAQGRNPLIIATPAAYANLQGFLFSTPPPNDPYRHQRAKRAAEDRLVNLKIWQDLCEGERARILDLVLPEVTTQTLILQGAESKVIHPATGELIQSLMRRARAVSIAGCGHLPMIEKPDETATALLEMLARVEPAPNASA